MADREDSIDLRHYLAVVRARIRIAAVVALVVLIATAIFSFTRAPTYTAEARVLINTPPTSATNVPPVNLETERHVAASEEVARVVESELGSELSAADLSDSLNVTQVTGSEILEFEFSAGDATLAQRGADAFADTYVQQRSAAVRSQLATAELVLTTRLEAAQRQLENVNDEIRDSSSGQRMQSIARREALLVQIGLLEQRLADLQPESTAELTAARVIERAELPEGPTFPNHYINLLLGLALGLLLGGLAAFAAHFWATARPSED